jgi:hypothetical protein
MSLRKPNLRTLMLMACCVAAFSTRAQSFSKLSAHLINSYTVGSSNIVSGKPCLLKVLALDSGFPPGMVQAMRDYKAKVPNGKIVVRVYSPKMYFMTNDATASANDFWNTIIQPALNSIGPSDRALIDFFEGPNEGQTPNIGYPGDQPVQASQWINQFWTNLTPKIVSAGYKPCIGSIAVGNIDPFSLLSSFVPALRQAKANGGAWSYHSYTVQYTTDVATEIWYSLRYRQFYDYFAQNFPDLNDMPLILTEGGVDQSGDPATSGWQARGTAEQFERWLNWFDFQMRQDPYVLGCTLFENGDASGWSSFDLEPIAAWMRDYLRDATIPSPPLAQLDFATGFQMQVSWTNAPIAPTTYNVKRASRSGGPFAVIARNVTEGIAATTYIDTNAPIAGTTNFYVVSALNDLGESANSPEMSVLFSGPSGPPNAPTSPGTMVSSGYILLTWHGLTVPPSSTFKVKRSSASGGPYSVIASNISDGLYFDTSVTPGTYYYVISAVNKFGEGPDSAQVSATATNALPDVIITSLSWTPANLGPNTNVVFRAIVKNQGGAATPNGVTLGVGFTVDSGSVASWSSGYSSSLAPGAFIILTADGGPNGVNYWTAIDGAHQLIGNVDDVDRFKEGNDGNNVLTVPFVVPVPPPVMARPVISSNAFLNWSSYPGKTYRVQYKNSLSNSNWSEFGLDFRGSGSSLSFTNVPGTNSQRFYRVLQLD